MAETLSVCAVADFGAIRYQAKLVMMRAANLNIC